jgi:hypothetical protein
LVRSCVWSSGPANLCGFGDSEEKGGVCVRPHLLLSGRSPRFRVSPL